MYKIIFSLILAQIFTTTSAQVFYLKPLLETKINIIKKNEANKMLASTLYKYEEFPLLHNDHFLPNSFGLLIGYCFKNPSIAIETGFYNTQSESGYRIYVEEYGFSNYIEAKGGTVISTIPFQLVFFPSGYWYQQLYKNKCQISLTCALSLILRPTSQVEVSSGYLMKISNNDSIYINDYLRSSLLSKHLWNNTMFSMGISFTALNHKFKELATISVKFYFINQEVSSEIAEIFINQSTPIRYYSKSTGSGFGLSISRNFNVYKSK